MPRRHLNLILAAAALGGALVLPQAASAKSATYKVVAATHSSNAAKTELPYQGTSSAKWSLARPTKAADNRFRVSVGNGVVWGMGMVNVSGVFDAQASSDMDSCSLSAPTGSAEYPAVAPQPLMLGLNKDPDNGKPAFVFTGVHTTLGNPYFGTGCNTSVTGEPRPETTSLKHVKLALFRKKSFTLRFAGSTMEGGIAYRWTTVLKFKRVR
jgi:hypothetical protein